jgi:hypothetical protein
MGLRSYSLAASRHGKYSHPGLNFLPTDREPGPNRPACVDRSHIHVKCTTVTGPPFFLKGDVALYTHLDSQVSRRLSAGKAQEYQELA